MPASVKFKAAVGLKKRREVKSQMTEEEITNEMAILDLQLKDLEKKGVKLEEVLREEMEIDLDTKSESDQLFTEWFELVQEKNKLVRRETDLVYLMQQQRLEQEHADVEFKIRKLMNKPESEKTEAEKEEESKLLDMLVEIVERRNTIINSIEEARLKEEEEDAAYDQLRSNPKEFAIDQEAVKKKKKRKVKKIFTKKKKNSKPSESDDVASPS